MIEEIKRMARTLPEARARAAELGLPLRVSDLPESALIPDEENAWTLLQVAVAMPGVRNIPDDDSRVTELRELRELDVTDPIQNEAAWQQLLARSEALDLVVKATSLPKCQAPSYELGMLKFCSDAIALRGQLRAERGDCEGMLSDFRAVSVLTAYNAAVLTLTGTLVATAFDAVLFRRMTNAVRAKPQFASQLMTVLIDEPSVNPKDVLWRDFAYSAEEALTFEDRLKANTDPELMYFDEDIKGWIESGELTMKEHVDCWLARQYTFSAIVHQATKDLEDPIEIELACYKCMEEFESPLSEYYWVGGSCGLSHLHGRKARRLVMEALLKVAAFKHAVGRLPETLEEAGFNKIDPYTNKPLLLKVSSDRATIYCVGENMVDENLEENSSPLMKNDIAATYP